MKRSKELALQWIPLSVLSVSFERRERDESERNEEANEGVSQFQETGAYR